MRSCTIEYFDENDKNIKKMHQLFHGVSCILGRSSETGIEDLNCSRQQIQLTADCEKCLVAVKQLGTNYSGVNGFALKKGEQVSIGDGDRVEILLDKYIYVVKFDAPKTTLDSNSRKRKTTEDCETPHPTTEATFEKFDNGLLYIFTMKGVRSSSKIAAYDMDGTLIKTKSGKVFPRDIHDWQISFPEVPGKLKSLVDSGYKVVVFTNQASIGNGKLSPENFKVKAENIFKRIGVSAQIFISAGKKLGYRKPLTGMWNILTETKNDNIKIDMEESFYCGDAAGRKGDHSFADRFFAENIPITFYTPEVHFKNANKIPYGMPTFDHQSIDRNHRNPDVVSNQQEILVLVGYPGCGKSNLAKKLEIISKGQYVSFCRDVLGSWQKCVSQAELSIKRQKSIIADSTNVDIESRERWISLAKKYNLPIRSLFFDVTIAHCKHNNLYRQFTDKNHSIVNDMVYNSCKSKFKEPDVQEGFSQILKMKFVPEFNDKEKEALYFKHYLEK